MRLVSGGASVGSFGGMKGGFLLTGLDNPESRLPPSKGTYGAAWVGQRLIYVRSKDTERDTRHFSHSDAIKSYISYLEPGKLFSNS